MITVITTETTETTASAGTIIMGITEAMTSVVTVREVMTTTEATVSAVMVREVMIITEMMASVATVITEATVSVVITTEVTASVAMVREVMTITEAMDSVRAEDPDRALAVDGTMTAVVITEAVLEAKILERMVDLCQKVRSRMPKNTGTKKSVVSARRKIRETARI